MNGAARNPLIAAALVGTAAGALSGWWIADRSAPNLAVRPPVAVIDYGAAIRPGEQHPLDARDGVRAVDEQVAALEAAGFLVLRADAVAAAPQAVRVPPPRGDR